MAGYISEFLHDYAPQFLTSSEHTLKSYRDALTLYIVFLEKRGITHGSLGRHCFERGFIKAEVVNYRDLLEQGSLSAAREKGLVGIEGKDYVVKDGDVILFRFNV